MGIVQSIGELTNYIKISENIRKIELYFGIRVWFYEY